MALSSAAGSTSRITPNTPRSQESFESFQRRANAADVLQSYEKVSWHSFQRAESLLQTRLHFLNIVAGFTDEDEAKHIRWREDLTPRARPDEEVKPGRDKARELVGEQVVAGPSSGGNAPAASSSKGKKRDSGGGTGRKRKSGTAGEY